MAKVLVIRNWDKNFENNRTRELKALAWVPVPNDLASFGLRSIAAVDENPTAIYGAWLLMVEVASLCEPRGSLVRRDGTPYSAVSLGQKTGFPSEDFQRAIPRLLEIRWLELVNRPEAKSDYAGTSPISPDSAENAETRRNLAPSCDHLAPSCAEGKGREGNRREGKEQPCSTGVERGVRAKPVSQVQIEAVWHSYPRKQGKAAALPKIKLAIREAGFDAIRDAVKRYAVCDTVQRGFVMQPTRFFGREKHWEDQFDTKPEPVARRIYQPIKDPLS